MPKDDNLPTIDDGDHVIITPARAQAMLREAHRVQQRVPKRRVVSYGYFLLWRSVVQLVVFALFITGLMLYWSWRVVLVWAVVAVIITVGMSVMARHYRRILPAGLQDQEFASTVHTNVLMFLGMVVLGLTIGVTNAALPVVPDASVHWWYLVAGIVLMASCVPDMRLACMILKEGRGQE